VLQNSAREAVNNADSNRKTEQRIVHRSLFDVRLSSVVALRAWFDIPERPLVIMKDGDFYNRKLPNS